MFFKPTHPGNGSEIGGLRAIVCKLNDHLPGSCIAFVSPRCYRKYCGRQNNTLMRKIIFIIIVLAAGIAIGIYFQKQPQTKSIENNVQTDATKVKADVEEAADKTKDLATNVAAKVKAGAQKVHDVTTNAVGEVKDKMP
jgi:uncharacterized protein HemX